MSGFSAEWLALREPVDHRSRNLALQTQVIQFLGQIKAIDPDSIHITDLGSGTGSNLRALAPHFGLKQSWTLVDYDADLLRSARASLIAWADSVVSANEGKSTLTPSGLIQPLTQRGDRQGDQQTHQGPGAGRARQKLNRIRCQCIVIAEHDPSK